MTPVLWAAWFGHVDVLECLVGVSADVTALSKQGMNALHCAASNNHLDVIDALSQHWAVLKDQAEKDGRTPLHLASEGGHTDTVTKLLEMQCNHDVVDQSQMTSLHLAAKCGHVDVAEKLLEVGVMPDIQDSGGETALHMAANLGHDDIITLLLKNSADVTITTQKSMQALHLAAMSGHSHVIVNLLQNSNCDMNGKNCQGVTPLHLAARNNQTSACDTLLNAGCSVDAVNNRLETPLHMAVEGGHTQAVFVLLKAGANTHLGDKKNRTALQMAVRGSYIHIVDMIIKAERQLEMIQHLESTGNVDRDLSRDFDSLQRPTHSSCDVIQRVLCKLALKHLNRNDWLMLANHWNVSPVHVSAISHEYSGPDSYRDHCLRLLLIWLCGLRKEENAQRILYESLVSIGRKRLAENIKRQMLPPSEKPDLCSSCRLS